MSQNSLRRPGLVALVTLLGGWCVAMTAAHAAELLLQTGEAVVTSEKPVELTFDVPAGWVKVYMTLEGRLFNRVQPGWRGGSMPCIDYLVNGKQIRASQIANLHDATEFASWGGEYFAWIGETDNWRLTYSPDFMPFVNDSNPAEFGDNPYLHVFDITSLVRRDGPNTLVLRHAMNHFPSFQMIFRQVRLLSGYQRPPVTALPRDLPDTSGRVIKPQTKHEVPYEARLLSGGAVEVKVGGEHYVVVSKFSRPGGGLRRLGEQAEGWRPTVQGEKLAVEGPPYRLERSLRRHAERLEIVDRLTNTSDQTIGIRLGHEVATRKAEAQRVYLCGSRLPRKEGQTSIDVHPLENPTLYVRRERSGVGLLPRDSVFRAHVELVLRDGAYGIHDRHLALAPGTSYEMRWEIYPTATPDYYSFVNAARRSLKANYTIDGNMVIAHGFEGAMADLTDDDFVRLVRANNAKYLVLVDISRLNEAGKRLPPQGLDGYTHGTGLMGEHGRWTRHWLEQVIARFRRLCPGVKLLPYLDPYVCSEPGAADKYADSLALLPEGAPQLYTDHKLPVFYPTPENSYGKALGEAFDYLLGIADGFYMDESTMAYIPGPGAFSYRPDTWDGHSCEMDLGGGYEETGATYELRRKVTNSALFTRGFRLRQLQKARAQGKAVWMNFQPMSEEEAALQSHRFVECYASSAPVYSHLGCPVSLANEHVERREADIGNSVRRMLMFGGLYLTYGIKYRTDGNILQDLYPFTPLELHCGYVIGAEKIITCSSGTYGFGDRSSLRVRVYDRAGFHLPRRDATVPAAGTAETTASLALQEGELAIVFRSLQGAEDTPQ